MGTRDTIYVSSTIDVEKRPPTNGRSYFFAQNLSNADVYYDEGTLATSENGIVIGAGQWIELSSSDGPNAVPQGPVWFRGSAAGLQRVLVKEG